MQIKTVVSFAAFLLTCAIPIPLAGAGVPAADVQPAAADEVVKKIPPQRDLPFIFVILFFTPSVAYGDSSLKREPRQDSELHFAASERNQYFVRLCDFKFDAKIMVPAGIK